MPRDGLRFPWAAAVIIVAIICMAIGTVVLWSALARAQIMGDFTGEPGLTAGTGIVITDPGLGVPGISIADTAVTPGTYGDETNVGQFTVDQQGRLTNAVNVPISASGTDTLFWLAGWQ